MIVCFVKKKIEYQLIASGLMLVCKKPCILHASKCDMGEGDANNSDTMWNTKAYTAGPKKDIYSDNKYIPNLA